MIAYICKKNNFGYTYGMWKTWLTKWNWQPELPFDRENLLPKGCVSYKSLVEWIQENISDVISNTSHIPTVEEPTLAASDDAIRERYRLWNQKILDARDAGHFFKKETNDLKACKFIDLKMANFFFGKYLDCVLAYLNWLSDAHKNVKTDVLEAGTYKLLNQDFFNLTNNPKFLKKRKKLFWDKFSSLFIKKKWSRKGEK